MDCLERIIQVRWRHRVIFADRIFAPGNATLRTVLASEPHRTRSRALLVLDEGLARARPELAQQIESWFAAHAEVVELTTPPLLLPGGEGAKNSRQGVLRVLAAIHAQHIDRHSFVIAVGGGSLLDTAGLAASLAHRGCRHVRIPTTTLSQADSGVGVKNGINAFGQKNFVGTFSPPFAVVNDFDLLSSLPERARLAGYAEAVKVACIRDRLFFEAIERDAARLRAFEPDALRRLIRRCAELHLEHIAASGDPFEFGSTRPLDFGHWSAHKLEQLSGFQIAHGDAVAIGLAVDVLYAQRAGLLEAASAERILTLLASLGFELFHPELLRVDAKGRFLLLVGLEEFREHLGGALAITLLQAVGTAIEVSAMREDWILAAIQELQSRYVRSFCAAP